MKCGVTDFDFLCIPQPVSWCIWGWLSSKIPNYPKGVSTKNFCQALWILAVKGLGGLRFEGIHEIGKLVTKIFFQIANVE